MLDSQLEEKLTQFVSALVNQEQAKTIVAPQEPASGFWFGGGNMIAVDGKLYVVGRFRDAGDSRTGTAAGRRGWELAIFESADNGASFEKVLRFDKSDLDMGDRTVLSIEGAALHQSFDGIELYVSTEKDNLGYPPGFENHLKPGTGVWTIERLAADSIAGLKDAKRETVLECDDPQFVHLKDPFVYDTPDGDFLLLFCSHPFCWTSSNTGFAYRRAGEPNCSAPVYDAPVYDFFSRGFTWDVAMTRGTCMLDVPKVGAFANQAVTLMFYDGGECVRNLDEHATAVKRPRGYSCEELGGAGYCLDGDFANIERLSKHAPLFVSPHGTGCSRYVDVLKTADGYYATWQQSQPDGSQPLVMNSLSNEVVAELLG